MAQALLRALHLVDAALHINEVLQYSDHVVTGTFLPEKTTSFLWSASLAISGEEITMAVMEPNLSVIIGP